MTICSETFRRTLGAFPTGVTVVTTRTSEDAHVGLTISSFTSLSLDPPQILFCLSKGGNTLPFFESSKHFAVNVLSHQQEHLSNHFASGIPTDWNNLDFQTHEASRCALIGGAMAHVVCQVEKHFDGGDHTIIIGRVIDLIRAENANTPLVRHLSSYKKLA